MENLKRPMAVKEFKIIAKTAFGPTWQTRLSEFLDMSIGAIYGYKTGRLEIPTRMAVLMRLLNHAPPECLQPRSK